MITLELKLTREDYVNFTYYTYWQAKGKKNTATKIRMKYFFYFGGLMVLVKLVSDAPFFDFYLFFSLFVLASIYLLPLFSIRKDTIKQTNKLLNDPLNFEFLEPSDLIISETGIYSRNKFAECRYNWTSIVKKEETNEYFFLYLNSIQAFIIPKRMITTKETRLKLENIFAAHISFDAEVGHLVKD